MKKYKKIRMTFTIPENVEQILREISETTGLKMSTIIEKGILLFQKESK